MIEIIYPKFNFVNGNIQILDTDVGNTKISLYVNENYKECGLGNSIIAKKTTTQFIIFGYLIYSSTVKILKYFGDFSSNLQCIHIPKQLLDLTGSTKLNYITYLKSLFNISNKNCSISFY